MCDCIRTVNDKLAPDQEIRGIIVHRDGALQERAAFPIYRKDTGRPENRRGRYSNFSATFCPFCGVRYEPEEG